MSDSNNLAIIQDFCNRNAYKVSAINVHEEYGDYIATVIVGTGEGRTLEESAFGKTEAEAKSIAVQYFIDKVINKPVDQMLANEQTIAPIRPLSESAVSSTQVLSSEVKDDISQLSNSIGHLNEICQKKSFAFPSYETLSQIGESHKPVFLIRCTLDAKVVKILGEGRGSTKMDAKKLAAQDVIRKWHKYQKDPHNLGAGVIKTDLNSYFANRFQDNQLLEQSLSDMGSDYCQRLECMAVLLNFGLQYIPSTNDTNFIVLKAMVKDSGEPLFSTFGNSDKGVDISRSIAAKKAILMIKILYTKDEN